MSDRRLSMPAPTRSGCVPAVLPVGESALDNVADGLRTAARGREAGGRGGRARTCRARPPPLPPAGAAVRRGAAAGGHRTGTRRPADDRAGRRADRQPRHGDRPRAAGAPGGAPRRGRHDDRRHHPRPRRRRDAAARIDIRDGRIERDSGRPATVSRSRRHPPSRPTPNRIDARAIEPPRWRRDGGGCRARARPPRWLRHAAPRSRRSDRPRPHRWRRPVRSQAANVSHRARHRDRDRRDDGGPRISESSRRSARDARPARHEPPDGERRPDPVRRGVQASGGSTRMVGRSRRSRASPAWSRSRRRFAGRTTSRSSRPAASPYSPPTNNSSARSAARRRRAQPRR